MFVRKFGLYYPRFVCKRVRWFQLHELGHLGEGPEELRSVSAAHE